jgi:hypothetical protein
MVRLMAGGSESRATQPNQTSCKLETAVNPTSEPLVNLGAD